MKNEIVKYDSSFVTFNVVLSLVGGLASVIPTLVVYVISLVAHEFSHNYWGFALLLIPISLYILWVNVLWVASDVKDEKGLIKRMPIFLTNTIITVPLLIFYLVIFLSIKF